MGTNVAFFASAEEQCKWLTAALRDVHGWCVVDHLREKKFREVPPRDVASLLAPSDLGVVRLFIGCSDLSTAPVWRETSGGKEIDFIQSRAIQYVPSFTIGQVLVEGRLDIMRAAEYELAGVEYLHLKRWFASVRTSLEERLQFDTVTLLVRSNDGNTAPSPRRVLVSRDAIAWHRNGGHLKQFPESSLEFDVVLPERA